MSGSRERVDRAHPTLRSILITTLKVTAPLHVLTLGLTILAMGLAAYSSGQQRVEIVKPFLWLQLISLVGLVGSFTLHECAHLVALRRCRGVRSVTLTATRLRVSLEPSGMMTPAQIIGVALLGPSASALVGVGFALLAPAFKLHWFYLVHLIFLLPCFGDGRSVVTALRAARREVRVGSRSPAGLLRSDLRE